MKKLKEMWRWCRRVRCWRRGHDDYKHIGFNGFWAQCGRCGRERLLTEEEMFNARKVQEISQRMVAAIKDEFGDECEFAGDADGVEVREISMDEARKRGWI